jgi:hypothetical protein
MDPDAQGRRLDAPDVTALARKLTAPGGLLDARA